MDLNEIKNRLEQMNKQTQTSTRQRTEHRSKDRNQQSKEMIDRQNGAIADT